MGCLEIFYHMENLLKFKNQKLLEQAFTHRSYLNENKKSLESNERLEFLGDSILSFVVSEHLYKTYPNFKEGVLTNLRSLLVNTKSLAQLAKSLNFGTLLRLSKGEEESKGRENETLLANCLEAFIGALYLDQGIEEVRLFLSKTLLAKAQDLVQKSTLKDPKSLLQELIQSKKPYSPASTRGVRQGGQKSPIYKVLSEEGPSHAKLFTVGVYVGETLLGKGKGKSKQEAEEKSARVALTHFEEKSK